MSRRYEMDMCHGPLFKKLIVFCLAFDVIWDIAAAV